MDDWSFMGRIIRYDLRLQLRGIRSYVLYEKILKRKIALILFGNFVLLIECITDPSIRLYRVSNNGQTTWRPSVTEVKVFSDQGCSISISPSYSHESGHNGDEDGSKAFDNQMTTHWRPQCPACVKKEAWVIFSTTEEAKCIDATALGKGGGSDKTWDTGIEVELQKDDCSWTTVMQSSSGNIAKVQGT